MSSGSSKPSSIVPLPPAALWAAATRFFPPTAAKATVPSGWLPPAADELHIHCACLTHRAAADGYPFHPRRRTRVSPVKGRGTRCKRRGVLRSHVRRLRAGGFFRHAGGCRPRHQLCWICMDAAGRRLQENSTLFRRPDPGFSMTRRNIVQRASTRLHKLLQHTCRKGCWSSSAADGRCAGSCDERRRHGGEKASNRTLNIRDFAKSQCRLQEGVPEQVCCRQSLHWIPSALENTKVSKERVLQQLRRRRALRWVRCGRGGQKAPHSTSNNEVLAGPQPDGRCAASCARRNVHAIAGTTKPPR